MSSHQIAAILIAAGSAFVVTPALADVLILRNGGRLEGDVTKTQVSSESKAVAYTVKLNSGVRLKIDGREVRKHIKSDPTELEYEKLLNAMPDRNVDAFLWKFNIFYRNDQHLVDSSQIS